MKKFKKLIPALCMLLISAVMLGSSTYAWFAMNNQVTATGMEVKAASNTQYLVISKNNTLGTETSISDIAHTGGIEIDGNKNNVYPCAKATEGNLPVASTGDAIAVGDWYTANSKSFADAGTVGSTNFYNAKKISDDELSSYHLTYTFYIGLATGSNSYVVDATNTLTIKNNNANIDKAIRVIVNVGGQEVELSKNTTSGVINKGLTLSTNTTTVTVTLYVDGNDDSVKSDGFVSISGNIDLSFEIVQ